MGSSEHPAVDGNLDKPKAEAGGRRTRFLRLIVWRSSPQPQADSSSPSRGVSGYPPALNGRCLRASPCSAPLPGASEHQRRADLSSFQRLLKLHARDRLGSTFRVSIPPPPRGSHRVVSCWQGTDPYSESTRLGAQLLATPQYSQYSRCCRRRSPELRTCVNMRPQQLFGVAADADPRTRQSTTLLQTPTGLPGQPARLLRAAINAGKVSRSENPAASSLAGPTLAARGWLPACEASAG